MSICSTNRPLLGSSFRGGLAQQSVTKYIAINLAAPKAGAKHEYLFNEPASGVTKFITIIAMNLVTFCYAAQVRLRCSTNLPLVPVC